MLHRLILLFLILILAGCATTAGGPTVNMADPATYVKVNFLKGNYDEVIRYSRTQGVMNERNDRLKILYYVGLSQLEKNDYTGARKTFELLKERDRSKTYHEVADLRTADSYFLEQKYAQSLEIYETVLQRYPKSTFLPYVYYRLVLASQKIGDFSRTKGYYEVLNKHYPESFESVRLSSVLDPMDLEGYSVQVGSFSDESKARAIQTLMMSKGYISSIKKTQKENLTYYRVRIHSKSRTEAEKIATRLRLEGYSAKVFP